AGAPPRAGAAISGQPFAISYSAASGRLTITPTSDEPASAIAQALAAVINTGSVYTAELRIGLLGDSSLLLHRGASNTPFPVGFTIPPSAGTQPQGTVTVSGTVASAPAADTWLVGAWHFLTAPAATDVWSLSINGTAYSYTVKACPSGTTCDLIGQLANG